MQAVRCVHPSGHIGVISGDLARFPAFYTSLMNLRVPSGSSWNWVRGNGVAANRNIVVREMSGEWLWFIDDDQTFAPDTLLRLLDRQRDIIQPLVSTRKPPFYPYAYRQVGEGVYAGVSWEDIPPVGVSSWDAVGTGGCLIRRDVLNSVADPWFEEGHTQKDALGEDLTFMGKARSLGFSCWVDSDVRCGHLTVAEVWPGQTDDGEWVIDLDLMHGVRVRVPTTLGANTPAIP